MFIFSRKNFDFSFLVAFVGYFFLIEEILDAVNEGEFSKRPLFGVARLTEAGREF